MWVLGPGSRSSARTTVLFTSEHLLNPTHIISNYSGPGIENNVNNQTLKENRESGERTPQFKALERGHRSSKHWLPFREPRFNSQHLHDSSQLSVTGSHTSSWPQRALHTNDTQTYAGKTFIHRKECFINK